VEDEPTDFDYFQGKRTDKTYISKRLTKPLTGRTFRIISKVFDDESHLQMAQVKDDVVLHLTEKERHAIKATLYEDYRNITSLVIQKYSPKTGPHKDMHFTFWGSQIDRLLEFLAGIRSVDLTDPRKRHVTDEEMRTIVLNRAQATRLFLENEQLFAEIAKRADLKRDIVAVGYRRSQLQRFEDLMSDHDLFTSEVERLRTTPEGLWQSFFEANQWIFGYGLSYQFTTNLDGKKLEQMVRGADLGGAGKIADGVMKTLGRINSLCFVEIKTHTDNLLRKNPYRSNAWAPTEVVAGGVAQVQATVQDAIEAYTRTLEPQNKDGSPTGEKLFNVEPRSFLVVGNLAEFETPNGVNEPKFRSFETYRRNTRRPEILTFDELLERARFIVEQAE
jgi:hypothetical protein